MTRQARFSPPSASLERVLTDMSMVNATFVEVSTVTADSTQDARPLAPCRSVSRAGGDGPEKLTGAVATAVYLGSGFGQSAGGAAERLKRRSESGSLSGVGDDGGEGSFEPLAASSNKDTKAMQIERDDQRAYFELRFAPSLSLVSIVRRFVSEFYESVLADAETTSRLAVATHELLENAVKFSSDGVSMVRIEYWQLPEHSKIRITTTNRASEDNIRYLGSLFDEMSAANDALSYYVTLMQRTAKVEDGSRLGLGRIRAETDMDLTYQIDQGCVVVHAETSFQPVAQS
jgi:hypothetical protein